jgi:hypothetical protein
MPFGTIERPRTFAGALVQALRWSAYDGVANFQNPRVNYGPGFRIHPAAEIKGLLPAKGLGSARKSPRVDGKPVRSVICTNPSRFRKITVEDLPVLPPSFRWG